MLPDVREVMVQFADIVVGNVAAASACDGLSINDSAILTLEQCERFRRNLVEQQTVLQADCLRMEDALRLQYEKELNGGMLENKTPDTAKVFYYKGR
ncbi:unnamed protein product [Gongylonema pulchrum]|uniref:Phage protein n=1 Tax=Gongylonema pulchrum TaxID=637853 RepID=A0A183DNI5_9BILA|nr:unnamed protein product [Gongylonema pulchrum]